MKVPGFDKQMMAGPYGNASKEVRSITLAAAPIDTEVEFMRLAPGTKLNDVKLVHGALGASVTLEVGVKFESTGDGTTDSDLLLAAGSASAAGARGGAFHPIKFDVPVVLTVTVKGAAATGKVSLHGDYEYIGTK